MRRLLLAGEGPNELGSEGSKRPRSGVVEALLLDRIPERAGHGLLPDDLVEDLWTPLSSDDFVRHFGISAQKPRTVIEGRPLGDR